LSEKQTVAGAFAKIQGHEELCAERYNNIHNALGDIRAEQRMVRNAAFGLLAALIGWMAVQIYDGLRPPRSTAQAVVAVNPPAPAQGGQPVVR